MLGITILYCLWVSRQIRYVTPFRLFSHYADLSVRLLAALGKTWLVTENACEKSEALAQMAKTSWQKDMSGTATTPVRPAATSELSQIGKGPLRSSRNWVGLQPFEFPKDPDFDWSTFDTSYEGTDVLLDGLGETGDWFFLDWLAEGDAGTSTE